VEPSSAEAQGRHAQLHSVPANDSAAAKLVHQSSRSSHWRAALSLRLWNVRWRSAAIIHRNRGWQDALQNDQLVDCLLMELDHDAVPLFNARARTGVFQKVFQIKNRLNQRAPISQQQVWVKRFLCIKYTHILPS
jgi:hypothetical protein